MLIKKNARFGSCFWRYKHNISRLYFGLFVRSSRKSEGEFAGRRIRVEEDKIFVTGNTIVDVVYQNQNKINEPDV